MAEDSGFDAVMISEHVVLGPDASANGVMGNPRDYAMPGNQDPEMPWPNSLMLLSAMASVTEQLRLVAGAIIAPLRHPLLLARELGHAGPDQRGPARRAADGRAGAGTSTPRWACRSPSAARSSTSSSRS